jgi:PAS domain S-box-containing protein
VRDYAIFMLDPDGRIATWNAGAQRIKGYRGDEIIGQHFSKFYPRNDVDAGKPAYELRVADREGRFEDEGWRLRKDGTRFWANVIITALRDPATDKLVGFAKVTRDLTERRRNEEERLRLAQAEEAVRLRDEFLSIASHELKTPLTAMQLQLQSLRKKVEEHDAVLASKVARATRSGNRLADLVEALLDVSRISTGRFELRRERFDLAASVHDVADRMREAAAMAGCQLSVEAPDAVTGTWDKLRVEQVLVNLLSNAFKYGAGSAVDVALARDGGDAVLTVRDFGPGIAEVDRQRIFGRFERAAPLRNYGGMGLGLYVAREIVEAHGGAVAAANAPDGGAMFTVRLPTTSEAHEARGGLH